MQVKSKIKVEQELSAWRQFLSRSTFWLGIWLLGSAVICAVAANWERLSTTQRFVGVQGLLALCVLAAAWLGWRLRATDGPRRYGPQALLALAGLLLGALLALLGQTYQTGADTWELFALWGILLLPWALVAMSQAVWLLWMIVANIALVLYVQEGSAFWWVQELGNQALPVAILNVLFLAGWEFASRRWHASSMIGPRVLVAWLIGLQVVALCFDNARFYGVGSGLGLLWIGVTVGLGLYYQRVRLDLIALAMLAAGVIAMSLRVLGEWWFDIASDAWIALPLAALLMGEAVFTARWLRRLAERSVSTREASFRSSDPSGVPAVAPIAAGVTIGSNVTDRTVSTHRATSPPLTQPWYVQGLLALSAWLATLLLLLFVGAAELMNSAQAALVVGLVLCVLGVGGLRMSTGLFGRQCLTAIGFAGQLLVLIGLLYPESANGLNEGTWLYVLVLGAVVYALGAEVLLRFLSACMMALALGALIVQQLVPDVMQYDIMFAWLDEDAFSATLVWLPVAVAGAWTAAIAFYLGYFTRSVDLVTPTASGETAGAGATVHQGVEAFRPLAWAFALAVQAMVWMAGGLSLVQLPALWQAAPLLAFVTMAGVLLPVACAIALLWPRRQVLTSGLVWGVPLGLLALTVFWLPSPGISFALAWMLLGFGVRDIRLMVVGAISLLMYLVVYYYQLQIPLLDKALWLGGAALLLFALRGLVYLVPRWMGTIVLPSAQPLPPVTAALRWRTAVVLAGLSVVLVLVNYAIWQREMLLTHGKMVILELAPVDPRSLMQGDYMALRFAAGETLTPHFGQDELDHPIDGYVIVVPDSNGVAQQVRAQADVQPLTGDEVAVRYRIRDRDVRIVTNAYFFPEGKADHYAQARYGEVRVGDDGTALLVRMLGPDRQPL